MSPFVAAERRGRLVPSAGVRLWAEEIGSRDAVAVLLVHRMAAQGFEWPEELIDGIVGAGYRAIVYDHRGFGWSESGPPEPPMRFQDLVDDAKAVLAAFDVTSAHLVGSSVGGVIARCVAIECPGLARSLTFIGSSPGDGSLPVWSPAYTEIATNPPGPSFDERVDYLVRELRVMSDDRFDESAARARAERCVRRGWTRDSLRRVARAAKHRSLGERDLQLLQCITIPCLVVHGSDDAVLGIEHGRMLAGAVPGAELVVLEGMGHEIQPHHAAPILDVMLANMARGDLAAAHTAEVTE